MSEITVYDRIKSEIKEIEEGPLYPGKYKDIEKKQRELHDLIHANPEKRFRRMTTYGGVKLSVRMKQIKALELRQAGLTWGTIAEQLGYSGESSARKAVYAALREAGSTPAEHVIQLEDMRLDRLFLANWPDAINPDGNPEIRRKAAEICLKIMERRSKLHGLDRPTAQTSMEQSRDGDVGVIKDRLMDRLTIMFEREREPSRNAVEIIDSAFRDVEPLQLESPEDDSDDYDEEIDEESDD